MSHPDAPEPQPSPPQPQATTTKSRTGHGLLATAILLAGIGGGLLAWHPWDKPAPPPPKDPQHITIQHVGDQSDPTESGSTRPVYCMTNETGALYCMVMPSRYTGIEEPH
jgi:hypothetical protein